MDSSKNKLILFNMTSSPDCALPNPPVKAKTGAKKKGILEEFRGYRHNPPFFQEALLSRPFPRDRFTLASMFGRS
jgi:hypothetical protein